MKVVPIMTLKVAVVPSWLCEAVTCSRIPWEDLHSFNKLYTYAEQGVLDKEEVYAYIMANQRLVKMFGDVFSDLQMISNADENLQFIANHQAGLDAFDRVMQDEEVMRKLEGSNDTSETSIFKTRPNLLEKEFYSPKVVQAEVLYLVGSCESTYKNSRAFYNAVIESVSNVLPFEVLKKTNLMKHYLRNAVND
ncbi:hypothetical protein SPLA10_PHROGS00040 [Salmonella phage SPLA10]|nr:hypothetical protein SPLA10_PHROGS00040 [Salmonella phage SPLA10]